MPKKPISPEEKEFWKECFEWFRTVAVERGYISKNWKNDLIEYIYSEMIAEGKVVKKESIRRNLNRMIAYYYETGAQARSGRIYQKYLYKLFTRLREETQIIGGNLAKYYLTVKEARETYTHGWNFLIEIPNPDNLTIEVYRLPDTKQVVEFRV